MLPLSNMLPTTVDPPSSGQSLPEAASQLPMPEHEQDGELREVFHQFVGETFYRQLLASLRKTTKEPAYFHGGRAEEAFQSQLDSVLAEKMTHASHENLSDSMFQLFQLSRQ